MLNALVFANEPRTGDGTAVGRLPAPRRIAAIEVLAEFAQAFRTNTQHQDHWFPENAFPFSSATLDDPVTGKRGSLLRNDGGRFEDVTRQAKLLSFHPTQTAVWFDYNGDGWLDYCVSDTGPPRCMMSDGGGPMYETGAAIGVWMDAGRLAWGDEEGMLALFDEIAEGREGGGGE